MEIERLETLLIGEHQKLTALQVCNDSLERQLAQKNNFETDSSTNSIANRRNDYLSGDSDDQEYNRIANKRLSGDHVYGTGRVDAYIDRDDDHDDDE